MLIDDLRYYPRDRHWFGRVNDLYPGHAVELTVEADQDPAGLATKLALVRELAATMDTLLEHVYQLAYQKYQGTPWAKPLTEIRTMYFLSGLTLQRDNTTWWVVLEPAGDVASIYNHLLRFTLVNQKIVWANFDYDATA